MCNQDRNVSGSVGILIEMRTIVREAAEPVHAGESVKAQLRRAARELGLTPRRAETLWYSHPARVLAEEADRLRDWRRGRLARARAWHAAEMARLDREARRLATLLGQGERGDGDSA